MATVIAPLITGNRATVSEVRRVIRHVLADYLASIGKKYPVTGEMLMDLEYDVHLAPASRERELVCNRICEELFCAKPHDQTRDGWRDFSELCLYFLSRGCVENTDARNVSEARGRTGSLQ